jgi:hypothetical protein
MKTMKQYWLGLLCGAVVLATCHPSAAADAKRYQVTGPVLEVTPTSITVQKGDDKWEVGRNGSTKIKGDLKVGSKVTIYYSMVATEIDVKPAKGDKASNEKAKLDSKK